jgi:hypothetical protein
MTTLLRPDAGNDDLTATGYEDKVRTSGISAVDVHRVEPMDNGTLVHFTETMRLLRGDFSLTRRVAYLKGDALVWSMICD